MREIKFRLWDGAFECYVPYPFVDNPYVHHPSMALEQFTGLLDKNGKEIYEGDIVFSKIHKPSKMEIRFVEGGFCAFWGDDDYPIDMNHFYDSKGCCIEVIGNIHENLALLQ